MKLDTKKQTLIIKRVTQNRWVIVNQKGDILKGDLTLASPYEAEQYIKSYVSSFINVNYEVQI